MVALLAGDRTDNGAHRGDDPLARPIATAGETIAEPICYELRRNLPPVAREETLTVLGVNLMHNMKLLPRSLSPADSWPAGSPGIADVAGMPGIVPGQNGTSFLCHVGAGNRLMFRRTCLLSRPIDNLNRIARS